MTNSNMEHTPRIQAWKRLIVLAAGLVAAVLFVANADYVAFDFRNNLWGPARLLLEGQRPYDQEALDGLAATWGVPFIRSVWFPTIVGAGLPLAAISLQHAGGVWLLLSLWALLFTLGLVHRIFGLRLSPPDLLRLALVVVVFVPLYAHLELAQVSLLVLASLVAGWLLIEQGHPGWAGLVLSLSWAKPQLVLLAWPALAWRASEKGTLRSTFVAWLAGSIAQTMPLWILDPTWPAGYLGALGANPVWLQPNIFSLGAILSQSQTLGWLVALLALVIAAIWLVRLWQRQTRRLAFIWALALTPILSLYTWSYDHVFLLPLLLVALRAAYSAPRRTAFLIVFLACQAVDVALRLWRAPDAAHVWYPAVLMLVSAYLIGPWTGDEPCELARGTGC